MNFLQSFFQLLGGLFSKSQTATSTSATSEVTDSTPVHTPASESKPLLSATQLGQITDRLTSANLALYSQSLSEACTQFGITDPVVLAIYLAQTAHETGGYIWLTELASGAEYNGRKDLGNTQPNDGVTFKGRGMIQITGRFNYEAVGKALGYDFVSNPSALAEPKWAALSAAWWWSNHNLTKVAKSGTLEAFQACTKVINGGLNGEEDREMYWGKAKIALGVK
jgi:predicted chitinase